MIVISHGDKAKRLPDSIARRRARSSRRSQHLGQPLDHTRLHLKADLHEVALTQRMAELQKTASHRNRRKLTFGALSVLLLNYRRSRVPKLDARSTPLGMRKGEGHAGNQYPTFVP